MIKCECEYEVILVEQCCQVQIEYEKVQVEIECWKLEQCVEFELEKVKLEGEVEVKGMCQQFSVWIQIEILCIQQMILLECMDVEQEFWLCQLLGVQVIQGQVVV